MKKCSRISPYLTSHTPHTLTLKNKLIAEFLGTFWLVFGGCGSAVLAAMFLTNGDNPVQLGIGFVGIIYPFFSGGKDKA